MENRIQVNGYMTISRSKRFQPETRRKILTASEGKAKAVRAVLTDSEGREIVLQGILYESKNGGLTARFDARLESFELVEVDAGEDFRKDPADELAAEILG